MIQPNGQNQFWAESSDSKEGDRRVLTGKLLISSHRLLWSYVITVWIWTRLRLGPRLNTGQPRFKPSIYIALTWV